MTSISRLFLLASIVVGGACDVVRADWRDDWAVAEGFALDIDAAGFSFPTAIAVVPKPGEGPDAPIYFVTEIRGAIKVVARDRTVHTFADGFFKLRPKKELPDNLGEVGMAGICLDPDSGYVFVSYVYEDDAGVYRNAVRRFTTTPKSFATKPTESKLIAPILAAQPTAISHMVGPLSVRGGLLYVSVGDGELPRDARNLDSVAGKILRMTLDGEPAPGNPHADADDPLNTKRARNYVYASGLRNPFSMAWANDDRLLVAENGPGVDRLVEVNAGDDFLYDGTNESSSTNALYVWKRAVSPVQMEYDRGASGLPDDWAGRLIIACSGSPMEPPGPGGHGQKTVVAVGYDPATGRVTDTPRQLMRYIGDGVQLPVGLALGSDGVYIVPLMPDSEGRSAILRLSHAPDRAHTNVIEPSLDPVALLNKYACIACHKFSAGPGYGEVGPAINRRTLAGDLSVRLNDAGYLAQLDAVDAMTIEPQLSQQATRDALRDAEGTQRVRLWVRSHLLEPRFDRGHSMMPTLGLSEAEADALTEWLLAPGLKPGADTRARLGGLMPEPTRMNMALSFIAGGVCGVCGLSALMWLIRHRRTRRG